MTARQRMPEATAAATIGVDREPGLTTSSLTPAAASALIAARKCAVWIPAP